MTTSSSTAELGALGRSLFSIHGLEAVFKYFVAIAIYLGSAGMGLEMAMWREYAPLIWPPAGFGLLFLLYGGFRYVPAVFIGSALIRVLEGAPAADILFYSLAYTMPLTLSAFILKYFLKFENAMERLRDVVAFTLVAVILTSLGTSFLNTWGLSLFHPTYVPSFSEMWGMLWLADSLGILVVGPMFLVWFAKTSINWRNTQAVEVLLWLAFLIFLGAMVFRNWAPTDTLRYPLELAMFPLMAWAAVRFGQRGATVGIFISAMMAVWELRDVIGPDPTKTITQPPGYLWVFVGILSLTGLFLAAVVTEIRNREAVVRNNEERLRAFIEAMPDLAFVITSTGRYLDVFAARVSGFSERASKLRGKDLSDLLEPETCDRFIKTISEVLETGELRVLRYPMEYKGKLRWFEGRVAPMTQLDDQPLCVIWVAYDITTSELANEELRYRDKLLQTLTEAEGTLLRTKDFDLGMRETLRLVGQGIDVDQVAIFVGRSASGDTSEALDLRFEWARDAVYSFRSNGRPVELYWMELPGWQAMLSAGRPITVDGHTMPPPVRALAEKSGSRNMAFLPIHSSERLWGVLVVGQCREFHEWRQTAVAALGSLAASLGGYVETKRVEDALMAARNEADRANQAKSEFLAMMSHEIRTPMNAIIGFTDLLSQTNITPDQNEYLKIITRSGRDLLELINNILDFSKLESAPIELEQIPFRLEMTILEVLEVALIKAREKGIALDCKIDDPTDGNYLGDPLRFRQILLNLVTNAVKFTNDGGVFVAARVEEVGPQFYDVRIDISDTGIGIPEDKLEDLFIAFKQMDSSTTREYGGTGLGLTISRKLAERMGGGIRVESEVGVGSTFHLNVIFKKNTLVEARQRASELDEELNPDFGREHPLRILLAEDDPVNTRLATELLHRLGYDPVCVTDGEAALSTIREQDYDLVIMDVQMRRVDGLEVTRRVRAGEAGESRRKLFILALTALAMAEDRERCMRAGFSAYLAKPISVVQFKQVLQKVSAGLASDPELPPASS